MYHFYSMKFGAVTYNYMTPKICVTV